MVASLAAGRPGKGRWLLAVSPVVTAVFLMVGFGLAAGGAAGSRAPTNPAVPVPGLLTPADAGPGWTATHSGALDAEQPGCFRPRAAMLASSPSSLVGVLLSGPAGLSEGDEIAARYADTGGAVSAFDSVARALRCSAYATPAGAATVVALAGPTVGDRAAGAEVILQSGGADVMVAQRGTAIVLVVYGTAGVPDARVADHLTAKALERLGP